MALKDSVAALETATANLTTAVNNIPNVSDDAAEAAKIDAVVVQLNTLTAQLTADVTPPPPALVVPAQAINAAVGAPVNSSLTATGGTPPYNFTSSDLPADLVVDSTGVVTGSVAVAGVTNSTIDVSDAGNPVQSAKSPLTITVA